MLCNHGQPVSACLEVHQSPQLRMLLPRQPTAKLTTMTMAKKENKAHFIVIYGQNEHVYTTIKPINEKLGLGILTPPTYEMKCILASAGATRDKPGGGGGGVRVPFWDSCLLLAME